MKTIPLTKGKVALVSDCDYEYLSQFNWYFSGEKGYAARKTSRVNGKQSTISMHAQIMDTPKGMQTDHINSNKLDNRRENLRVCTQSQNMGNTKKREGNKSGYKGVYWNKAQRKFKAQIKIEDVCIYLGSYDDPVDAAISYNVAAKEHYGEFAFLNIINQEVN